MLSRIFAATAFANLLALTIAESTGVTHVVTVGSGGTNAYSPNSLYANPGDVVSFQFWPTNHSVVRGEYAGSESCGAGGCNPCVPFELIHPGESGMFASQNFLEQTIPNITNLATHSFNLTINDTNPIWYYCTAIDSCTPNGMVGVINPQNGSSINTQVAAAKNASLMLTPGEPWPAEGSPPGSANTTNTTASGSSNSGSSSGGHKLSSGAIAGIAIAAAAVVILCAALCYYVGRSNTYESVMKQQQNRSDGVPSQIGDGTVGPWSPAQQSTSPHVAGGWDHRFSGQTQISQPGSFMNYNRLTGAHEYVAEAPNELSDKDRLSPGHPAFGPGSNQETTYELSGDHPPVAEVGPYK